MSLVPSGLAHLLDHANEIKADPRLTAIGDTGDDTSSIQKQLLSYIDNSMERFEQRQRTQVFQVIFSSQAIKMPIYRDIYFPDVEKESIRSSQGRSNIGGPGEHAPYESEQEDPRHPLTASAQVSLS